MSAPKHTPGPWHVTKPSVRVPAYQICERIISDSIRDQTPEEEEANLRLIAAAPDLLAALKQCYLDATRFLNDGDFKRHVTWDVAYIDDAIAKAEGRKP